MTPLGHLPISCLASRTNRRMVLAAVVISGLLPDVDYIFVLFPWFNQMHRVVTHNLGFVALAAAAGWFFSAPGMRQRVAGSMLLGGMLHLLVDACMDSNPSNGIGVALLWPFSMRFFCPVNLLAGMQNQHGWAAPAEQIRVLLRGMIFEVPLYAVAVVMLVWKKRREG